MAIYSSESPLTAALGAHSSQQLSRPVRKRRAAHILLVGQNEEERPNSIFRDQLTKLSYNPASAWWSLLSGAREKPSRFQSMVSEIV